MHINARLDNLELGQKQIRKGISDLRHEVKYAFDDAAVAYSHAEKLIKEHEKEFHHAG